MSNNYIVNVPKLKGRENYDDWAFAVENFLILEGLEKCINASEVTPEDAKAKAKIILTIDTSLYVHIKETKSSKELWDKLKNMFDDSGFTRKIHLLRNLISIRLENCDSMAGYVTQIIETCQKLRGTGFNINEEWIGSLLLAGLPEKFSPMIMAIEHSGIDITADAIKTKLLDMESDSGKTGTAFTSRSRWQPKGSNRCFKSGNTVSTVNSVNAKEIKCYRCKQPGHFRNKCPNAQKDYKNNNEYKQKAGNAFSVVFLNNVFDRNGWYVDSGANTHLTVNKEMIKNPSEGKMREIMVANNSKVPVTCSGDVEITTVVGNNSFDVVVKNALCVPELTTNLLSVSQLIKNGNTVNFKENCCKIYNNRNELIGVANLVDGVYKLNTKTTRCLLATKSVTSDIWHRRFGHINSKYLNKMKNDELLEGLFFKGKAQIDKSNCVICCEGKQSRLPFPQSKTEANGLLEIIHADVCGPMEIRSIGGSRYFLVLEDDFSKMGFVYFLKTKDEVFDFFKKFKIMAENQKNRKIKVFRSDNGGEFCANKFEEFLKNNGIIHQKTNVYTPQQNGTSERLNRTLVEKARCLLSEANLDKKFWAEAINHAMYLRNRSIASKLNNKTPFEIWTGKKPNVNNLRIFGSPVMIHVPKENRLKWDKKAKKGILIGYSEYTKGYRVYDLNNDAVMISRDVIIMENIEAETSSITDKSNEIEVSVGDAERISLHNDEEIESDESDSATQDEHEAVQEEVPVVLRRSQREPKPKRLDDYVTYICTKTDLSDPVTIEEALSGEDKEKWQQAISEEIQSFEENEAWELVDVPESSTIVKCKWVFKRKMDGENKVRYRARLVAKGFSQKPGIDFDETFSPVVRFSTLRLLFALAVQSDLNITHLDVTTAFLNGFLDENVYMMQPEGLKQSGDKDNKVLKLKKAIYGLKQSSRAWYKRVDDCLTSLDYKKSKLEHCLFIKSRENCITVVALYVDDFFIFSNDEIETGFLKEKLSSKFKIKDLGQVKQCLGMRVNINRNKGVITLDQENYINQLLNKFNMVDCKESATPMEVNLSLNKSDGMENINVPYQQLIGSLMYLAVLTRPDIAYSVSFLSQFNNCHNETHWNCAKRILKYLQRTKNFGLSFVKGKTELEGFVDADWASNTVDRRSYTGFCFRYSNCVISWESKKQRTVALSSTEAEYMGISEACKEAIYLRNLFCELTGNLNCVTLFNDNQSAQKLPVNPLFHNRSKHIDVRHHFIREAVCNKLIKIEYLATADMPADLLTKSLTSVKHDKHCNVLGVVNLNNLI